MKIAYITKTPWGENSPGFVFSYFQSKGFAENGLNTSLLMKVAKSKLDDKKRIDINLIKNVKIFDVFSGGNVPAGKNGLLIGTVNVAVGATIDVATGSVLVVV